MGNIHLYNQYLFHINYLPDTILGTDDMAVNKNKALCSQNLESKYSLLVTSNPVDDSANIWPLSYSNSSLPTILSLVLLWPDPYILFTTSNFNLPISSISFLDH